MLLVFCFYTKIFAQEKTKIKIERAGFFEKDKNKFPDASVLTRDKEQKVLISHDGVLMTCNQAFFYVERNFIEAFGEVSLKWVDSGVKEALAQRRLHETYIYNFWDF